MDSVSGAKKVTSLGQPSAPPHSSTAPSGCIASPQHAVPLILQPDQVGTRDKTPEDLQALELGEADEGKLRARMKQIDIGKNTEGYRRLLQQGLRGRPLQVRPSAALPRLCAHVSAGKACHWLTSGAYCARL